LSRNKNEKTFTKIGRKQMSSKQLLTKEQIFEITNSIPERKGIPKDVAVSIKNKLILQLRKDLQNISIYPELFQKFKDEIVRQYYETLVPAGEAVGILTAQSIGERQTQATLSSFHSCGLSIKTVVVGVPRFSELLNATKNPKMTNCIIFLDKEFENISEIRNFASNDFTCINLKRIVKKTKLIRNEPLEDWHYFFNKIFPTNICLDELDWRFRFELNISLMYEYKITIKMVADAIKKEYGDSIVFYTPEYKGIIDVFIEGLYSKIEMSDTESVTTNKSDTDYIEEDEEYEDLEKPIEEEDVMDPFPQRDKNNIDFKKILVNDQEEDIDENIEKIIYMEDKVLPSLLDIKIAGMDGIKDIFFEKRNIAPANSKEILEWIITTEGSNLQELFCHPLVDKTKTLCNDMWEIYKIFGIEAARQFLIEEYMDTVSSDGTFVNISHVQLLVDIMTYTGVIISISRYGQKKIVSGPLAMASFEQSLDNFLKAAINGEKETTNGVSASIMLGKIPNIGTGVFDLSVDIEQLTKQVQTSPKIQTSKVQTSPKIQTSKVQTSPKIQTSKVQTSPKVQTLTKKTFFHK
jgi:DNA-directed RNA polymerase II subunit RPB1